MPWRLHYVCMKAKALDPQLPKHALRGALASVNEAMVRARREEKWSKQNAQAKDQEQREEAL